MTKTLGTAELLTRPEALLNHLPSKLSEGPVWHPEKGCLIAVLIDRGRVVLVSPTGDLLREFRIGCRVGAAGLCADPSTLILAVEKGWASLSFAPDLMMVSPAPMVRSISVPTILNSKILSPVSTDSVPIKKLQNSLVGLPFQTGSIGAVKATSSITLRPLTAGFQSMNLILKRERSVQEEIFSRCVRGEFLLTELPMECASMQREIFLSRSGGFIEFRYGNLRGI